MTAATTPAVQANIADITIENQASYTVRFDTTTCGRCGGTGYWGPSSVDGGRCFGCVNGTRRTTRGEAAYKTFGEVMDELMAVSVLELKAGDQVYLQHGWRILTEATERPTRGSMTVGRVTTEWTREMWLAYGSKGAIIMSELFKVRRYTPQARLAMLHRMCGVAGATVQLKQVKAA